VWSQCDGGAGLVIGHIYGGEGGRHLGLREGIRKFTLEFFQHFSWYNLIII